MSPRPEEYLDMAMARQAKLISESQWDCLLRPERTARSGRRPAFRNQIASQLRRLADHLQAEPDLLAASG